MLYSFFILLSHLIIDVPEVVSQSTHLTLFMRMRMTPTSVLSSYHYIGVKKGSLQENLDAL